MNRGTLRGLIKGSLGGATNLTDTQINELIDNAIKDIATVMPPERVPELVVRSHIDRSLVMNPGFLDNDGTDADKWTRGGTTALAADTNLGGTHAVELKVVDDSLSSARFPVVAGVAHEIAIWSRLTGTPPESLTEKIRAGWVGYSSDGLISEAKTQFTAYAPTGNYTENTASSFTPAAGTTEAIVDVSFSERTSRTIYIGSMAVTRAGIGLVPSDALSNDMALYVDAYPARRVPLSQVHELNASTNPWLTGTEKSPLFAVEGNVVKYAPSAATSIECLYKKNPAPLVGDHSEPPIPLDAQTLILPYVAWWGALASGEHEEAQAHQASYMVGLQRFMPQQAQPQQPQRR